MSKNNKNTLLVAMITKSGDTLLSNLIIYDEKIYKQLGTYFRPRYEKDIFSQFSTTSEIVNAVSTGSKPVGKHFGNNFKNRGLKK